MNEKRYSTIAIATFTLVIGFLFGIAAHDIYVKAEEPPVEEPVVLSELSDAFMDARKERETERAEEKRAYMQQCMEDTIKMHESNRKMIDDAIAKSGGEGTPYHARSLSFDEQQCGRRYDRMKEEESIREKYAL